LLAHIRRLRVQGIDARFSVGVAITTRRADTFPNLSDQPHTRSAGCPIGLDQLPSERPGLAIRTGGLAYSDAHPVVSAAGVKGGEKCCQRASPATFRAAGRCRGNHLPCLVVLAPNQHEGALRASLGEEFVGAVLIRSGVALRTRAERTPLFAPFSMENVPVSPIVHDSETWIRVDMKSPADSTRD